MAFRKTLEQTSKNFPLKMSTAVLKGLSMVGFWLVVMIICPLPLYSKFFNPTSSAAANAGDDEHVSAKRSKRSTAADRRARLAETICSFANSLSGGLFLALGLIHLLPEAAESFATLYGEETVDKYRPAFAVAFLSYTLLLVIQRVVFGEHGHSHGGEGHDDDGAHHHDHHHHDHHDDAISRVDKVSNHRGGGSTYGSLTRQSYRGGADGHDGVRDDDAPQHHLVGECHRGGSVSPAHCDESPLILKGHRSGTAVFLDRNDDRGGEMATRRTFDILEARASTSGRRWHEDGSMGEGGTRRQSIVAGDADGSVARARSRIHSSTRRSDVLVSIVLDHAAPDEMPLGAAAGEGETTTYPAAVVPPAPTKVVTSIVLMLAFALHGFAEGMALGVQEDTDSVGLMIIAIAMHKWAEAMSIGLSFQKSGMPKRYCMIYIIAFSLSSPVGIGVGWASEVLLPEAISAYLLAFSTGTFLYLGASDAIVEEFAHSTGGGGGAMRRWIKLAFYMIGAALIFIISVYFDRDHDDGGGSEDAGGV